MFRRHSLDVTDIINPNGKNLLAVLIYPPDHPGRIPPQGGQGGDHEVCHIYDNVHEASWLKYNYNAMFVGSVFCLFLLKLKYFV